MTYNYFNELKNSFEKCAYDYSVEYDSGDGLAGVEDALAAATGATADVGRVADTVEETGGAVQKSLDELTPAATGALDALKWAPVALAGIPTAGYLLHQYLRGNYDDKKKKEKEAAYLGKRAMQKEGGYLSEVFGNLPIAGSLAGAGIGALTGDGENALLGGLTGAHLHNLVNLTGAAGSLATPTRDAEDQRKADATGLLNFVPGVSSYNLAKRLGYSIRNPELTEGKANKSFPGGKKDKKDKEEEKEAAYLGKRAMEKAGQRWFNKLYPTKGVAGQAIPALGGGLAAYELSDSPTMAGFGGVGSYMMLSPHVNRMLRRRGVAKYGPKSDFGMSPAEAKIYGQAQGLGGLAVGKAGILGGVHMAEQVPQMMGEAREGLQNVKDMTSNLKEQSKAPETWTISDTNDSEWDWKNVSKDLIAAAQAEAVRRTGGTAQTIEGAEAGAAQTKLQKALKSGGGQYLVSQFMLPEGERSLQMAKTPTTSAAWQQASGKLEEIAEGAEHVTSTAAEAARPFATAISQVGKDIGGAAGESRAWREDLKRGLAKAAPVGTGALGGYILSQLLGPSVRKNETPSEREKRERLQRIYSLLGTTGGGALGYYLANRLGGAGAGANTKTGGDVKSFKTIARLGRASA